MHEKDAILSSINEHGIWSDFLKNNEIFMAFFDIKFREVFVKQDFEFMVILFLNVFADLIVGKNL